MRVAHRSLRQSLFGLTALAGGLGLPAVAAAQPACTTPALNALSIRSMTITAAVAVAASGGTPAYCRVQGNVTTDGEGAGTNQAGFQVDLPAFWNGKFLFLGGGGFDGNGVMQDGTPQQLAKGYATSSTNSGHTDANGTFAITDPGVPNKPALIDYFYRSRHQVGIASKQLVLAYYDASKITYSYFMGCSNGGRQGLMEASRYPQDYVGIVSGAPWMDPLGTELWSLKNVRALLQGFIPPSLFPQLQAAVLSQCDAADGVSDGLIQNPALCAFDPDALVPSLLTQDQATAIKTILAPVTDSTGHLIYPGSPISDLFSPYSFASIAIDELSTQAPDPTASQPWGAPPLTFGTGGPGNWYLAYNMLDYLGLYEPDNDLNSDTFEKAGVVPTMLRKELYDHLTLDLADDPSKVATFLKKGGKLILYHGYSDSIISPYRTVLFYEELAQLTGGYKNRAAVHGAGHGALRDRHRTGRVRQRRHTGRLSGRCGARLAERAGAVGRGRHGAVQHHRDPLRRRQSGGGHRRPHHAALSLPGRGASARPGQRQRRGELDLH
jgi:feruloyl esterase